MLSKFLIVSGTLALVNAQAPPPTSLLTSTQSGVLPIIPTATPFAGEPTIEGAITYDGNPVIGFTGPGGNASIQQNSAASYLAVLPSTNFDSATGSLITGSIMGTVPANGTGVMFTVNFTGFPSEAEYGPFVYHIHGMPVPADGNCTATLGHLDPTDRGELYACENVAPQTCQAGDLAGKHGNITSTSFSASYLDLYLSTNASSPYFFGDKSIVIHSMNTTRLTCANFSIMAASSTSSPSTSGVSPVSSPTATYTGVASTLTGSGAMAGIAGLLAFLL